MDATIRVFAAIAASALAAHAAIEIRSDYPGGNVKVEKIDEAANAVSLRPDYRDTPRYFHWDFTLSGAAGRKLHFQFPKGDYLSSLGPAISRDGGRTWTWLNADGRRVDPIHAEGLGRGVRALAREGRRDVRHPLQVAKWPA